MTRDELRQLEIAAEMAGYSGADVAQWFGEGFGVSRSTGGAGLTGDERAELVALYWREWRRKNPERARAYVAAYLARDAERKRAMKQARKTKHRRKHCDAYNAAQRAAYARRVALKKMAVTP